MNQSHVAYDVYGNIVIEAMPSAPKHAATVEYVDNAIANNGGSAGGGGTGSGAPVWGDITGTLANQTDLQAVLDAKYAKPPDGIPAADLTSDVQTILTNASNLATTAWGQDI